jgi:hypothetical protein
MKVYKNVKLVFQLLYTQYVFFKFSCFGHWVVLRKLFGKSYVFVCLCISSVTCLWMFLYVFVCLVYIDVC